MQKSILDVSMEFLFFSRANMIYYEAKFRLFPMDDTSTVDETDSQPQNPPSLKHSSEDWGRAKPSMGEGAREERETRKGSPCFMAALRLSHLLYCNT